MLNQLFKEVEYTEYINLGNKEKEKIIPNIIKGQKITFTSPAQNPS